MSGAFATEFDKAVEKVKYNERTVKEFMTYEMALLESRMEGEIRGREEGKIEGAENIAIKMLNKGVSFEQIQEFTELSIQRIKELAQKFEDKKEDV